MSNIGQPKPGQPGNRAVVRGKVNIYASPVDPLYDCPHPAVPTHIYTRYAIALHREGDRNPVAFAPHEAEPSAMGVE